MPLLTYTSDDLVALRRALLSGALEVRFQDRTVIYRSVDELLAIIGLIEDQLDVGPVPIRQYRMSTDKGY